MTRPHPVVTKRHMVALIFSVTVTALTIAYRSQLASFAGLSYFGAFFFTLIGNATLILPAPAIVFIYILGGELNPVLIGLLAGLGGALGEITGYMAGFSGSGLASRSKHYKKIHSFTERYGLLAITAFAFIPNPTFDLVGISAGALKIKLWKFLIAAFIGIAAKMLIIAFAGYYY